MGVIWANFTLFAQLMKPLYCYFRLEVYFSELGAGWWQAAEGLPATMCMNFFLQSSSPDSVPLQMTLWTAWLPYLSQNAWVLLL